ncbi:hypothetical protein ACFL96_09245 [Thermoproteota archaeon]
MDLAKLASNILMLNYGLRGNFRDRKQPFNIHLDNIVDQPIPDEKHSLIIAAEGWDDTFTDICDPVAGMLKKRSKTSTYLHDPDEIRHSFYHRIMDLAETEGTKIVFYAGPGSRWHPWMGDSAFIMPADKFTIPDSTIYDLIKDDEDPWIFILHSCFSGLFAKNITRRPNTIAVATHSERSTGPPTYFTQMLMQSMTYNHDNLLKAFKHDAQMTYDMAFYTTALNLTFGVGDDILKKFHQLTGYFKSEKQLYANKLDPEKIVL